ncbi:MAG: hypothetical protein ACREM2_04790 [Vulcanimicrobiaceae bacterium]
MNGRRTADEIVGVSPQFVMAHVGRFSVVHAVGRLDDAGGSKLEEVIREAAAQSDGPLIVSFLECEPVAAESCQTVLLRLFKLLPTRLRVVAPPESALRRHLELLPAGRVPPLHDGFRQAILGVCDSHEILRDRPQASGAAKSGCSAQEPGQAPARTVPERRAI